ncbi:MAG: Ig-like domain-containing protein, partial [Pseudomonadota bacterium]
MWPRLIGSLIALVIGVEAAQAQSGPPFPCTGDIYQVQSGQLRIFDPITSTYQNVGSNQGSYNATGYNILDNFAYASQGGNLIRIFADGSTEVVFNLGFGSFSGDVDLSNNFWLRRNNLSYYRIDIATGDITVFDFTGPGTNPADVFYFQSGGEEFLIGFRQNTLIRYNITTGIKETVAVPGLSGGGGYGAAWTDFNGRVFTFNNRTGLLYEVFDYDTNSPSAVIVGQGDPSNNNDGFSCVLQPFPNLAPVAFDDDYTTPVNVAVVDNVIEDNGNGMDNDPDGTPVTVNTTPVSDPSNGTVVLNPDGTFTYTPDTNFIGTDTFVYEISDTSGLTAQATVTIVVEGDIDFALSKSVTGPSFVSSPGEVLSFTVELENTGDIPLTDIVAEDVGPDGVLRTLTGQIETGGSPNVPNQLDVGETWTFSYDYSVTQDDIDSGGPLVNTASATSDETGTDTKTDQTSTTVSQDPLFSIEKDVDTLSLSGPGLLTYTVTVENTGNVTLTNPSLVDTIEQSGSALTITSGPTLTGDTDNDGELDVDEIWVYNITFSATQAEIDDAGDIVNTAEFTTDEAGMRSADATTEIDDQPNFTIAKTVDTNSLSAPGLLTYDIEVVNTGNV